MSEPNTDIQRALDVIQQAVDDDGALSFNVLVGAFEDARFTGRREAYSKVAIVCQGEIEYWRGRDASGQFAAENILHGVEKLRGTQR